MKIFNYIKKNYKGVYNKLYIKNDKEYYRHLKEHNTYMKCKASEFQNSLRVNKTKAEGIILQALNSSVLKGTFVFQYIVNIYKNRKIEKFYIADFCFYKQKIILEIDGEYHFTKEQYKKDIQRSRDLEALGYTILRLDNEFVLNMNNFNILIKRLQNKLQYGK